MKSDAPCFNAAELEAKAGINRLADLGTKGNRTVLEIYRDLGRVMWDKVGMARTDAGLKEAITRIQGLRGEFNKGYKMATETDGFNGQLELAGRVQDFLELGELMATDALQRSDPAAATS